MQPERILVIANDSPSSLKAVKYGYTLAAELGAKVALLGVVDEALTEGNVDAGIFPDEAARQLKEKLELFLHQLARDYANGVDTEMFTPEGEITQTILQTAREWDAHLIVVGTHGRTGLNRLLMGSVAEDILRHSTIPVFIVPIDK